MLWHKEGGVVDSAWRAWARRWGKARWNLEDPSSQPPPRIIVRRGRKSQEPRGLGGSVDGAFHRCHWATGSWKGRLSPHGACLESNSKPHWETFSRLWKEREHLLLWLLLFLFPSLVFLKCCRRCQILPSRFHKEKLWRLQTCTWTLAPPTCPGNLISLSLSWWWKYLLCKNVKSSKDCLYAMPGTF